MSIPLIVAGAMIVASLVVLIHMTTFARWLCVFVLLMIWFTSGAVTRYWPQTDTPLVLVQDGLSMALIVGSLGKFRLARSDWLVIVALGWCALSILNPAVPNIGLGVQGFRLTGASFALFLAGRTLDRPERLIDLCIIASLPTVAMGLRQVLFGLDGSEIVSLAQQQASYIVGTSVRLPGAAQTGQDFAFHLLILTAIAIAAIRFRTLPRTWGWGYLIVIVGLQFLTLQRSTLAAAFVLVLVAAVWDSPQRRIRTLAAVLSGAIAVVLVSASASSTGSDPRVATAFQRFTTLAQPLDDESAQERLSEVWPRVFALAAERPLAGWGPGSAGTLTDRQPTLFPNGSLVADNLYLHVGFQYGIIGLGLFLWMMASIVMTIIGKGDPSASGFAGVTAVAGLLIAGLGGSFISLIGGTGLVMLLLGSGVTCGRDRDGLP